MIMFTSHPTSHPALSRPAPLHGSKSFSRMGPSHLSPLTRTRASTLQDGTPPDSTSLGQTQLLQDGGPNPPKKDIFDEDPTSALDGSDDTAAAKEELKDLPAGFDDLPIELVSLTDRYGVLCDRVTELFDR